MNFVDWFFWGEEVFDEVCSWDVFVMVLVGYLSCYWCYVMVLEFFSDLEVVEVVNVNVVFVKVD